MDLLLKGKTALVTASSGGIGFAIAKSLAREGTTVIINGRSEESVSSAIADLQLEIYTPGFQPEFKNGVADLGTKEGCDKIIETFPEIDILVNNVGYYEAADFFDQPDEAWQKIFEVNILSAVRLSKYYGKKFIERGNGRIVFISSETAINPDPNMANYGATKTMLLSISRNLAELTKGTEVTVNTVMPGSTNTESVRELISEQFPDMEQEEAFQKFIDKNRPTSLINRLLDPQEIGDFVCFVCSPKASGINGAALRADGGMVKSVV